MPSRPFRLLAYDFDGTLVDTKEDIALSVNLALGEMNLPPRSREEIFSFVGHGVLNLMKKAVGTSDDADAAHAVDIFRRHYRLHVLDTTRFYPNCIEVLEHFQWREEARDQAALAGELADVALYLLQLASVSGIDLEQAVLAKLAENGRREWPDP